jgi:DNA invertase Pin-like site-specific DNA recombinase
MRQHPKVRPHHLERLAYVYIRQSSPRQVEEHLESQALQYQVVHRAQALGWSEAQIQVIDEDLGKSGATVTDRYGFQALVSAVGLGRVGIILVTDVSRLARNCSDWYQLLDLASVYDSLISDASGVYDPRIYNDRLLLGLKGAFSEAQWYQMRTQLHSALLNKARRGELAIPLPVGYTRLNEGSVVLTPDREVQDAIRLVFAQFQGLGNARAVLRYFRDHALQLPRRVNAGPARGDIVWRRPSYSAIYDILKHPAYAGVYTYGKHHTVRLPGAQRKVVTRRLPRKEWAVVIQDAFPGYITWEQYVQNQEQLRQNAQSVYQGRGAPRSGAALLQGIVLCGRCGRRMRVIYNRKPAYVCVQANHQYGEPRCQRFSAAHVDAAVGDVFLQAVQPVRLEAALAAIAEVEAQQHSLAQQWQHRLERARYEADLARRRYERVDPDMRLVAAELERQWENRLQACLGLEQEWTRVQAQTLSPLSEADEALIRQLAEDLPALWLAESTTPQERKRLLRCLIQDVTLDAFSKSGFSIIRIHWHTGTTTVVEAERPRPGRRADLTRIARIRELAQRYPDDQVAAILNAEGLRTTSDLPWTLGRVRSLRQKHKIPTACPYVSATPGPRGDGLISTAEAAQRLEVTPSMIADWFHRGLLAGHQHRAYAPLWVRLTDRDVERYNGSTILAPDMVPFPKASEALGMTPEQLRDAVHSGQALTYRIWIKNRWRWYVQLSRDSPRT